MLWHFITPNRGVQSFGPYDTYDEACSAFQRVYGYWPDALPLPYEVSTYHPEEVSRAVRTL